MDTTVDETAEQVEVPKRLWLRRMEISGHPAWLQVSGHDSEDVEYVRVDAPDTRQWAERLASSLHSSGLIRDGVSLVRVADIIAAEFDK